MKKYHRERDALIDLCSCRLSAPLPEEQEQDEDMDDGAGGPEDVE